MSGVVVVIDVVVVVVVVVRVVEVHRFAFSWKRMQRP